jgi:hypothetical protein
LEALQQKLGDQEDKSNKMYLHMYSKEQDASGSTSRVSCEFADTQRGADFSLFFLGFNRKPPRSVASLGA